MTPFSWIQVFTGTEKKVILIITLLLAVGLVTRIFKTEPEALLTENSPDTSLPLFPGGDSSPPDTLKKAVKKGSGDLRENTPPSPTGPEKIDINTAGKSALISLPGIGPVLAGAIIEYRLENGEFREPADLIKVKGIGPKKLKKMLPFIQINEGK